MLQDLKHIFRKEPAKYTGKRQRCAGKNTITLLPEVWREVQEHFKATRSPSWSTPPCSTWPAPRQSLKTKQRETGLAFHFRMRTEAACLQIQSFLACLKEPNSKHLQNTPSLLARWTTSFTGWCVPFSSALINTQVLSSERSLCSYFQTIHSFSRQYQEAFSTDIHANQNTGTHFLRKRSPSCALLISIWFSFHFLWVSVPPPLSVFTERCWGDSGCWAQALHTLNREPLQFWSCHCC